MIVFSSMIHCTQYQPIAMPPTRRKVSSSSARAQQTLAFGPNSNKITKPSPLSQPSKKLSKPDTEYIEKAVTEVSTPSPATEESKVEQVAEIPRLAIRPQQAAKSDVEEKAAQVSNAQVKEYWKCKEEERIAPRVHQQGLSLNEKVLRHFDLSSQYGVGFYSSLVQLRYRI